MDKRKDGSIMAMLTAVALLVVGSTDTMAQGKGVIIKKNGPRIQFDGIKWKGGTKQYDVKRGTVTTPVPLSQVSEVRVTPPAGLKDAIQKVRQGSYSGAHVIMLEKVVKNYQMIQHDMTAGEWLIRCYVNTGRAAEAAKISRSVRANRDKSQLTGGFVSAWLQMLLENENYATLDKELTKLIETGSRPVAASAQLLRGEIDRRKGNYHEALVGGFLRTVVLFADVKAVQPEALFKAAQCFEELGETPYAEKMRQKLLAAYPASEYSRKLQAGG